MKQMLYGKGLKDKLLKGVNKLYDTVKLTLGPEGKNVLYFDTNGKPTVTKDGISVLAQITDLDDEYETLGAYVVRQASSKTAREAGDGTTTTCILAAKMFEYGLKQGLHKDDLDFILAEISTLVKPCETLEDIESVATISANNDKKIGKLIAEAIDKVGNEGVVTIGDSPNDTTFLSVMEGMQVSKGYASPHFTTDENKVICEFENPKILISDKKIETFEALKRVLGLTAKNNDSLIIIAPDISGEVIDGLAINHLKGVIRVCPVKAPLRGELQLEALRDLCIATSATLVGAESGIKLGQLEAEHLGTTKRIKITKEATTLVEPKSDKSKIKGRLKHIKEQIAKGGSEYELEKLRERAAKLAGAIAVIKVGAATPIEAKELKDRTEDALGATRAAMEEGIIPGAGMPLYNIGCSRNSAIDKAIREPAMEIAFNIGLDKVREIEYNKLYKDGIIDPVKVTKQALKNAFSVASTLLKAEGAIIDKENE